MADFAISTAEQLIAMLGRESTQNNFKLCGNESQLLELQNALSEIRMVLLDAATKWDQLSDQDRVFIQQLKDVVYDADDVFDEFRTRAELNQLERPTLFGRFRDKVASVLSLENQASLVYRMSHSVKNIQRRLDGVKHVKLELHVNIDYSTLLRIEETTSYVVVGDIIGREHDKMAIINKLLSLDGDEGVGFFAIVGVGGSGKTAMAQLVYNDERIKQEFPIRSWVCVADQETLDVKAILCQILQSITCMKVDATSSMELLISKFEYILKGKKYFIILDDVWNEDREKWLQLKRFLMVGEKGCRVVVTTRSETAATIIGDGDDHVYKLGGLSEEDSWRLFELSAFSSWAIEDNQDDEFVRIGKKIIKQCYNIPLAIRVVGGVLYGQSIRKWKSFERSGLANVGKGDNKILSILKLSYDNLKPSMRSCFMYCAIFPKGIKLKKEKLLRLWIAQGCVVPLNGDQNIEDAAEEHFSSLLRKYFLQDLKDEYGDVEYVTIHDLLYDLAQEMGKEEICIVTSTMNSLGDNIRHVHHVGDRCLDNSLYSKKIRSYVGSSGPSVDIGIENWKKLRVLDLSWCKLASLPDSIGGYCT